VSPFNPGNSWNQKINVYLSSRNILTDSTTAVGALKAALANSVAFAAIMGRVGLL
jgi:ammonia channel protein AmtB